MKLIDINIKLAELEQILDELENSESTSEEQLWQIRQAIEHMEGEREEKLLGVARWRKQLQLEVKEVLNTEIKRLQERKKSYERKVNSLGDYLYWGLEQIDGNKIKSAIGTLYLQRNSQPSVEIINIDELDNQFWVEFATVPKGEFYELPAGNYRFELAEDGSTIIRKLEIKAIIEHHKATGEIPNGTNIEWGKHVQFR